MPNTLGTTLEQLITIATRLMWRGTNRRRSMFARCRTMLSATSQSGVSYPTPMNPSFPYQTVHNPLDAVRMD